MKYTKESLQNTWGVVESKEHAEFIIKLAELHGFLFPCMSNKTGKFFAFDSGSVVFIDDEYIARYECRQITIPLPPKSVKNEWPQVGDEVTTRGGTKGVLIVSKPDNDGMVICNFDGEYALTYLSELQKLKTPEEELRDDVEYAIHHFEGDKVAGRKWLMSKYNITKKDKGDE